MFARFLPVVLIFLSGLLPSAALGDFTLENASLRRSMVVEDGVLRTSEIANKLAGQAWQPGQAGQPGNPGTCEEFRLRVSNGTECPEEQDVWLTVSDFRCTGHTSYALPEGAGQGLMFTLENPERGLSLVVRYELRSDDFYLRKWLEIRSETALTLECVEVESIPAADAYQPYKHKEITAQAAWRWKPGLGQPLYTTRTGTFWGIEFPAATNSVDVAEGAEGADPTLRCGYLWGGKLVPGEVYRSYPAVLGVGDDPAFITDAFWEYIDRTRIRPIRLQVQYNSWFDYGWSVSREKFAASVERIHRELVEKRGCPPLRAYVIDSGWERASDVLEAAWPVNHKFDPDFASTRKTVAEAQSTLGLWLSPGCLFGARPMVKEYREAGYEALSLSMSMCGPKYMAALQERMVELTRQGVTYFKLDGVFGHLNTRDFELHGRGCPAMPQLGVEGFSANDKRLNAPEFDELKTYYLVAGTERLIPIFQEMHRVNPDVFIVVSNGAWLSPWWLQHVDTVWMINAGDAAGGATRTEELVYRDGVYHNIWKEENTQYPMVALFNHEPKKTSTGESADVFRNYLFMHLSRGTSFLELYIKPAVLCESDWDVLAEGVKWAHEFCPTFQRARMHGGDPSKREAYGYSGWDGTRLGYLSVHNPATEPTTYEITLDRRLGMLPEAQPTYRVTTRIGTERPDVPETCRLGDVLRLTLDPGEIRVLEFRR